MLPKFTIDCAINRIDGIINGVPVHFLRSYALTLLPQGSLIKIHPAPEHDAFKNVKMFRRNHNKNAGQKALIDVFLEWIKEEDQSVLEATALALCQKFNAGSLGLCTKWHPLSEEMLHGTPATLLHYYTFYAVALLYNRVRTWDCRLLLLCRRCKQPGKGGKVPW